MSRTFPRTPAKETKAKGQRLQVKGRVLFPFTVSLLPLLVSAHGAAQAQTPVGQLSYIEADPLAGAAREGEGRGPVAPGFRQAFVEVVHNARLRAYLDCVKSGRADCNAATPQHEWSVPFIPEQNSGRLEEALSRAWNRFDARTIWRLNSIINSGPQDYGRPGFSYVANCLVSAGASPLRVDAMLGAWAKNPTETLNRHEFCDGLLPQPAPTHAPGLPCSLYSENSPATVIFWPEVKRRYDAAMKYALTTYYARRYWDEVNTGIDRFMPYALAWDGVYNLGAVPVGTMGGSVLQPVFANAPQTQQYANLAKRAQGVDPRGWNYILQRYPYKNLLGDASKLNVNPNENLGPEPPGIPSLEALKRRLAQREDILQRPWQWASYAYARPRGSKGLGDLREYEGVGHASFLRVFARQDLELSPRAVRLMVSCVSGVPPRPRIKAVTVSQGPKGRYPVRFALTRAHTGWASLTEGYAIENVRGIPRLRNPIHSPAYVPPGTEPIEPPGDPVAQPEPPDNPAPPPSSPAQPPQPPAPKPQQPKPPAPKSPAQPPQDTLNWKPSKPGDADCNVATVQYALRNAGINVPLTGSFDAATRAAVERYQRANGLNADGVVGNATWEKLYPGSQRGQRGNGVAALQFTLNRMGYYKGKVDGVFGGTTEAALREFQKASGIQPNGMAGRYTWNALVNAACSSTPTDASGLQISAKGREQMWRIIAYARANNSGSSHGRCMNYVWGYMTKSGYGKLDEWGDLPGMNGDLARGLPDYLNASSAHLEEAGLQRADTALKPPITNPYDPRIPPGAIIVVGPGSTGTSHPTAGDIVVKGDRPGEFINDGPAMSYGGSAQAFRGTVLGVYVPR